MKYALVVAAFLLGMALSPVRSAKAGLGGTVSVEEVDPDGAAAGIDRVVGFSCAYDGKKMRCFIASQ